MRRLLDYLPWRRRRADAASGMEWVADRASDLEDLDYGEPIDRTPWKISYFLELPHDLGVPENSTTTVIDGGYFVGTEGLEVRPLPGLPPLPGGGLHRQVSLLFRRAFEPLPQPHKAVRTAFPDLFSISGTKPSGQAPRRSGAVVQMFCADGAGARAPEALAADGPDNDWLTDQFERGFVLLNDLLTTVSVLDGDPSFGPVAREDLPPVIPYLFEVVAVPGRPGLGPLEGQFLLHTQVPVEPERIAEEVFADAVRLLGLVRAGGHPFYTFGEAFQAARRALYLGQPSQAILQAGTAVEVLVTALIREIGAIRQYKTQKLANILAQPKLKNQLEHHLGQLLRSPVDLSASTDPVGAWFGSGYRLRNAVAHNAYRASRAEARTMIGEVEAIVGWAAAALRVDPLTTHLADSLVQPSPGK